MQVPAAMSACRYPMHTGGPRHPRGRRRALGQVSPGRRPARGRGMTALVEVRNLVKQFRMRRFRLLPGENVEIVRAVRGVSFQVERGEVLGLVGESGSGKTTVGRTILGLEPPTSGSVLFKGQPAPVGSKSYLPLRRQLQMIFQDSYGSMDPRMAIGDIIEEPLRLLTGLTALERRVEVRAILHEVGLNEEFLGRF